MSLLKQKKEPQTQDQLEKMCCITLKSRAIDFLRKKKLHIYNSEEAYNFFIENITSKENISDKEKIVNIRLMVTEEEFEFMMAYLESVENKSNTEKTRFFRLKNKIKKSYQHFVDNL